MKMLIKLKIIAFSLLFGLSNSIVMAQTPFADLPTPRWATVTGATGVQYFDSPDEACRAQHAAYNPGATYFPPEPYEGTSWTAYLCKWTTNANSNTLLPTTVFLGCQPDTVNVYLRKPGVCTNFWDERAEQDCGDCGNNGQSAPLHPKIGNPISLESGAKLMSDVDYSSADGLFRVDRHYRSRPRGLPLISASESFGFGPYWHGLVPGKLVAAGAGSELVQYLANDGSLAQFTVINPVSNPNSVAYAQNGTGRLKLTLVTVPPVAPSTTSSSEFRLDFPNGDYVRYARFVSYGDDQALTAVPIEHGLVSGYKRYFDYTSSEIVPYRIRDSFGRIMTLTWQKVSYLNTVATPGPSNNFPTLREIGLPDATRLIYSYDSISVATRQERLTGVRRLSAANEILWARSYLYEDPRNRHWLTGTKDQNGARLSTYAYNGVGMATLTEQAGGVNKYQVEHYALPSHPSGVTQRVVTNPLSRVETWQFARTYDGGVWSPQRMERVDGAATGSVPADSHTSTYNGTYPSYLVAGTVDAKGNVTTIANDFVNRRPTAITEAAGTPSAITTNIVWHPTLDLRTEESRPGLKINSVYDAQGRRISHSETDTTTHILPYATAGQVRTTSYSWDANGRLTSMNGPRPATGSGSTLKDDIISYIYDVVTGNLTSATNGLGHITSFSGYDANGRPALMTDPNGIRTAFTYDGLGRAKTITLKHPTTVASDAITTLEYDVEGRVIGLTAPATEKLIMDYDLAGRLTSMRAANGERIDYSHDAMSNIIAETVKRTNATIARSVTRTFDALGRMLTETLGLGRTSAWEYDKNGNPTKATSARNFATMAAFDPLNRLVSTVAPDSGTTAITFNKLDDVISNTDAAAVQTTMVRNGFGEVIQEVSPDRGTSIYYYDAAGDMTAMIDGRGQRIDYTRDIVGRVLSKTPVGRPASEVITYSYDAGGIGSYQKGKLTKIVDGSGTTSFQYDHRGNMLVKRQVIGTTTGDCQ